MVMDFNVCHPPPLNQLIYQSRTSWLFPQIDGSGKASNMGCRSISQYHLELWRACDHSHHDQREERLRLEMDEIGGDQYSRSRAALFVLGAEQNRAEQPYLWSRTAMMVQKFWNARVTSSFVDKQTWQWNCIKEWREALNHCDTARGNYGLHFVSSDTKSDRSSCSYDVLL